MKQSITWYLFSVPFWTKHDKCLVALVLEKYERLSELVAFAQNWAFVETRMDHRRENQNKNEFWLFSNTKISCYSENGKSRWKKGLE